MNVLASPDDGGVDDRYGVHYMVMMVKVFDDGEDDDDDGSGDKKQSGKLRQSVVPGFRLSDDKRRRQEVHKLQSG